MNHLDRFSGAKWLLVSGRVIHIESKFWSCYLRFLYTDSIEMDMSESWRSPLIPIALQQETSDPNARFSRGCFFLISPNLPPTFLCNKRMQEIEAPVKRMKLRLLGMLEFSVHHRVAVRVIFGVDKY